MKKRTIDLSHITPLAKHLALTGYICIFGLMGILLARNPFSQRTLIPNFEPFPDSFHYLTPPSCWLRGQGWGICTEFGSIRPSVPPLYSIVNLPALILFQDPRAFYFTNVGLVFISIGFFFWFLKRLKISKEISIWVLLLLVVNPYLYWLPTLAMAEMLLLPLFLAGLILLTYPITAHWLVLVALIVPSFFATKYAAFPITAIFGLCFASKIWLETKSNSVKLHRLARFGFFTSVFFLVIAHQQVFSIIQSHLSSFQVKRQQIESGVPVSTSWFSWQYVPQNLPVYVQTITGQSTIFLWRNEPLIPAVVAWVGIAGLFWSLKIQRHRLVIFSIFGLTLAQLLFMSRFYVADARYLIIWLPLAYVGIGLATDFLLKHFAFTHKWRIMAMAILAMITLALHAKPLKAQIGLNLKYAETPWYYLSVQQLNSVFTQLHQPKPTVVTAVPRNLIDFYSNGNYHVMPLSTDFDMHGDRVKLFGDYDYSDLIQLYSEFLTQGKELYVMNYGIGNVPQRNHDWEKFQAAFELELVKEGCHGLCNVWKIKDLQSNQD